jgi:hypothetical protein
MIALKESELDTLLEEEKTLPHVTNSEYRLASTKWNVSILADLRWIDEQRNCGATTGYRGQHIAVMDMQIIDSDLSHDALIEKLKRKGEQYVQRCLTVYIPHNQSY